MFVVVKRYILPFFIGLILTSASCEQDPDIKSNINPDPNDTITITKDSIIVEYFGVNLSGAEFGGHMYPYPGNEGTAYGYPTANDLDYFNSKGLKLIRFPFKWERVQHELNGPLYEPDVNSMKQFVQAATDRDMHIFIDMHNYGRRVIGEQTDEYKTLIGSDGLTKEHLADVWKKLATEFKDFGLWGYDIMNEPHDMTETSWFDISQAVIHAIRSVDTETPIIISGDRWSSALHWKQYSDNLKDLIDPSDKLIFQAHLYFDKDGSGTYKLSFDDDGALPTTGVDRVRPFVEWLIENDLYGFIGEYGVPDTDEKWFVVLENMLKFLQENGVPGTYWSAGPIWGSYSLAVQPTNNYTEDRPQMEILEKYTSTASPE